MKLPPGHVAGLGVRKATAYGGWGQKMLEKMGWSEGQGLGKAKHGMREAIEVKKKEDNLGVGAASSGWKWDWKYWEDAYNTGLKTIKKKKKKGTAKRSSSSSGSDGSGSSSSDSGSSSSSSDSSSDSDSDSSESDAEHNARLAAALNRDGTSASASAAELRLAKQLAKDPWGRFGGREGKMARIRRQEAEQAAAMQARLGIAAAPQGVGGSEPVRKRARAGAGSEGEDAEGQEQERQSLKKKKEQKQRSGGPEDGEQPQQQQPQQQQQPSAGQPEPAKRRPLVVVVDLKDHRPNVEAFLSFRPTPATGWWGEKAFASAGLLEGLEQEQQQRPRARTTFDEDMQAKVYMAAHGAQRQGKRGIGKSSTIKIAGGSWKGKKVTFDEEGAEQQQQHQADSGGRGTATAERSSGDERSSGGGGGSRGKQKRKGGKVKWASLAAAQLREAPGNALKWKRLWRALALAAAEQHGGGVEFGDDAKAKAFAKLRSSDRLLVTGKVVSLVT